MLFWSVVRKLLRPFGNRAFANVALTRRCAKAHRWLVLAARGSFGLAISGVAGMVNTSKWQLVGRS